MRLINYGPGELSDRLTILSLKILRGLEQGKSVDHFKTEQTALLADIRSRTLNGKWFAGVLELAAVNAALWHAEDELREQRKTLDRLAPTAGIVVSEAVLQEAGAVAIRIQDLNDQRARLVQQINEEAGEAGSGREKL